MQIWGSDTTKTSMDQVYANQCHFLESYQQQPPARFQFLIHLHVEMASLTTHESNKDLASRIVRFPQAHSDMTAFSISHETLYLEDSALNSTSAGQKRSWTTYFPFVIWFEMPRQKARSCAMYSITAITLFLLFLGRGHLKSCTTPICLLGSSEHRKPIVVKVFPT